MGLGLLAALPRLTRPAKKLAKASLFAFPLSGPVMPGVVGSGVW